MPLSPAVDRQHLHTRRVECRGFYRADGLWDIEGHITDVKTYAQDNEWRGELLPGDPVHEMWIRLTIDDAMIIRDLEAVTDKSPYRLCPDIAPNFKKLIGLRLSSGFHRQVREVVGGVHGCVHLIELLGPMATVAFQTLATERSEALRKQRDAKGQVDGRPSDAPPAKRKIPPRVLNTCHAWASDGEVVKRWAPDFYTGLRSG